MVHKPLCFVLMPFGKKSAGGEKPIDFDAVYRDLIKPAVEQAGLEPIRADEEQAGGIIHKPMFERLVLCDFAVADLTTANANVFYELGVRHAAKPRTTVLLYAEGQGRLPFDVAPLRAMPYPVSGRGGPANTEASIKTLVEKIKAAKKNLDKDSPLYQLLDGYPDIAHEKTDVFRSQVAYAAELKKKLREARKLGRDAIYQVELTLGALDDEEAGVIVDLFLSYRGAKAWDDMVRIFDRIDAPLQNTILVREQYAFALNRAGNSEKAEEILLDLIEQRGASSETYGILGRVYKDRWRKARDENKPTKAKAYLKQAIEAYSKGFEADWRDAYPGINALTLIYVLDRNDPRLSELQPVVEYAVRRKIASGTPDYWDYATLLEFAVLSHDQALSEEHLANLIPRVREPWEPETTADNIQLLADALPDESEERLWILIIIAELRAIAKEKTV
ncbi:DUF4071 domain-containing protein (plasmid) [Agrobacterium sp. MA01]|uniref:TRAFs-binding domain-containing protein n=1 Tax=Agrobacterium sp. MA01 TaxID=2664893 RepID=UPI00129B989A|nr:TRAFs-binding domain-containing protein [Agrobacterium sp. MA01]QGG93259.1 DUF4071 domain-containing protein [Agrobacterium sp. MA01]